jgi:guanosine-3',5'-bis(diphosphate) 3'-pyrophosphohydrolase
MHLPIHALRFAATQHAGQARKDRLRTPYINHPIHVMSILTDAGIDDAALLAAAALHDTVEDTNTTLAQIDELFGAEVAALVAGVTDDKNLKKAQRKQQQIEHMPHLSAQAQWLKIADKTANLEDLLHAPPHDWSRARLLEYVEWAVAVVGQCTAPHAELLQRFDAVACQARLAFADDAPVSA